MITVGSRLERKKEILGSTTKLLKTLPKDTDALPKDILYQDLLA